MSTRGLIRIYDDNKRENLLLNIYKHSDWYISGLWQTLYDILKKATIVDWIKSDQKSPYYFNGMWCLSAFIVSYLKDNTIWEVYISPANEDNDQDYNYTIFPSSEWDKVMINIKSYDFEATYLVSEMKELDEIEDKPNT